MICAVGARFIISHLRDASAQTQLTLAHAVPIQSSTPGLEHQVGLSECNLLESLQLTQERTDHFHCVAGILRLQDSPAAQPVETTEAFGTEMGSNKAKIKRGL